MVLGHRREVLVVVREVRKRVGPGGVSNASQEGTTNGAAQECAACAHRWIGSEEGSAVNQCAGRRWGAQVAGAA